MEAFTLKIWMQLVLIHIVSSYILLTFHLLLQRTFKITVSESGGRLSSQSLRMIGDYRMGNDPFMSI